MRAATASITSVKTNIAAATAYTSGVRPNRTLPKRYTGNVVTVGVARKTEMMRSSNEKVNASTAAARIAVCSCGKVRCREDPEPPRAEICRCVLGCSVDRQDARADYQHHNRDRVRRMSQHERPRSKVDPKLRVEEQEANPKDDLGNDKQQVDEELESGTRSPRAGSGDRERSYRAEDGGDDRSERSDARLTVTESRRAGYARHGIQCVVKPMNEDSVGQDALVERVDDGCYHRRKQEDEDGPGPHSERGGRPGHAADDGYASRHCATVVKPRVRRARTKTETPTTPSTKSAMAEPADSSAPASTAWRSARSSALHGRHRGVRDHVLTHHRHERE